MKYHYVYRITNKILNKHYYGVRTCKINPKDDIGFKYFSSSLDKEFIKDQKENPHTYKYKVVKVFESRDEANKHEQLLHDKFNVSVNELFYNRHNSGSEYTTYGKVTCLDLRDNKTKSVIKSEFYKHNYYVSVHKNKLVSNVTRDKLAKKKINTVVAIDTRKGEKVSISKKEFDNNEYYIGVTKGVKPSKKTLKKLSNATKGANNPRAKKINIYNDKDELMYECNGNFKEVCNIEDLPYQPLMKSYKNNSSKIYTCRKPYNKEWINYRYWYAKEI